MTTGDEPQLSNPNRDDNAPMISGRGTEIIVSARGAYLARNLRALAEYMTDDQRLEFGQALVRLALDANRADIIAAGQDGQPEMLEFVDAMESWLAHPGEANQQRLQACRSSSPHLFDTGTVPRSYAVHPFASRFSMLLRLTQGGDELRLAIIASRLVETSRNTASKPHWTVIEDELEHWYVEAVWALLQGRPIPTIAIDPQSVDSMLHDPERWHRKRNQALLLYQMTSAQNLQFKWAVLQQVFHYIETVPVEAFDSTDLKYIETARRWFAHPELVPLEYAAATQAGESELASRMRSYSFNATFGLLGVFSDVTFNEIELMLPYVEWVIQIVGLLICLRDGVTYEKTEDIRKQAREWQVEAAYAILTHQPIPPLGDSA